MQYVKYGKRLNKHRFTVRQVYSTVRHLSAFRTAPAVDIIMTVTAAAATYSAGR